MDAAYQSQTLPTPKAPAALSPEDEKAAAWIPITYNLALRNIGLFVQGSFSFPASGCNPRHPCSN